MSGDDVPIARHKPLKTERPISPFLIAEWRYLVMLNYEIDPAVLVPLVPRGAELDVWNDTVFVTIVGFLFKDSRMYGFSVPGHRSFEEVNLRFYVRRRTPVGSRRAVTFVREFVPKRGVAFIARSLYHEPYRVAPMGHQIRSFQEPSGKRLSVLYSWRYHNMDQKLGLTTIGELHPAREGSLEHFVLEHYWGLTAQPDGGTLEYQVQHDKWQIRDSQDQLLECDIAGSFGEEFVPWLSQKPSSGFLAEGSPVRIFRGAPVVIKP